MDKELKKLITETIEKDRKLLNDLKEQIELVTNNPTMVRKWMSDLILEKQGEIILLQSKLK